MALALPPPGGPSVVDIVERRYDNAVQQDIFLYTSASTAGQNVLRVKLYGPVGLSFDSEKSLSYSSIRASEIAKELRREFPASRLTTSPLFLQNNYGPFGYAFGRGQQNDGCLYGWQQIRSPQEARSAFQNRGTIQVRLRLCEEGASEEKLLAAMYGYTINGAFSAAGWNPYGEPPKVEPGLGQTGSPIYPRIPEPATRPPAEAVPPVPPRREAAAPTIKPPSTKLQSNGEIVPSPISGDIGGVVVPRPTCAAGPDGTARCG
ncbi:cellulose biosynthesis protein BcsN [Rhizobium sp. CG5]|uniref:cellulose biosynthesis protein BcsN n=1 Tax=Rhizobium sp. CG5 TaxID=2726076 RepID=UPI0020339DD2|nr:cellulose biosynthesis protein BcsN [Rhizobium sp. CG5]